jgi:hypothetical protein
MGSVQTGSLTIYEHEGQTGLLLWAEDDRQIPGLLRSPFRRGEWCARAPIQMPARSGRVAVKMVDGWWLSAAEATAALAPIPLAVIDRLPRAMSVWALASKWVIEAVARHQVVPALETMESEDTWTARWRVSPVRPDDRARIAGLASAMPGVARAMVLEDRSRALSAISALRRYMDEAVDGLLRAPTAKSAPRPGRGPEWIERLGHALAGPDGVFTIKGLSERDLPRALAAWTAPATSMGDGSRPQIGFRLEEPPKTDGSWCVSYHLLDATGEERVAASVLHDTDGAEERDRALVAQMHEPQLSLLQALGRCTRVFPPISRSLNDRHPTHVSLDAHEAWRFLTRAGLQLQRAGYWVDVPAALSRVGRRRVRARMRVGISEGRGQSHGLLAGLVNYRWEASLGDDTLTAEEFRKLANQKAPLVRHRGKWVAVDPDEVARLIHLMETGEGEIDASEAIRLALAGEVEVPGGSAEIAEVIGEGSVAQAMASLRDGAGGAVEQIDPPVGLAGELRPYQSRGLAWLKSVNDTGFGACLADDMGLGKTIQALSHMQLISEATSKKQIYLVVCPTSVLGNWRREIERFTPRMGVVIHHGPSRASSSTALRAKLKAVGTPAVVVITSFALVRRDISLFKRFTFDLVTLDEAQNIKNPETAQSKAVRELKARRRLAMTGTPVENRLTEFWSIMDFLSPGLLGSQASFKRRFAVPVERYGDEEAAEQLRRVTAPFVLRRLKSDPAIAPDLPEKVETVRYCPLTHEQAALYQQQLDSSMASIKDAGAGIERRGKILALITALKQICNHPAHYLKDGDMGPARSGKLNRFMELVSEVLQNQGNALIFTQYREMGTVLQNVLQKSLGRDIPFYHGGLARNQRDHLVADFQRPFGPPLMIVSLKAGGTGLNLTRANHVFHYDRWWNPAVEDQATDRTYRIGQTRDVTVHRMVCQGTLEEQIHQILEEKRFLADKVVGSGETWLSELDDATLNELVNLGSDAVLEEEA